MTRLWDTARRKRLNCPKVLTLVPVRKHRTEKSSKKRDWTICLIKPLIVHKCIICIGSNYNRKENLLLARRRLVDLFPTIRFTSEQETRPLFFRSPALFSNQVAMFFSEAEEERVRKEPESYRAVRRASSGG